MTRFPRITVDPTVMGGRPCIRGLRFTVANLLRVLAGGHSVDEILRAYPYIERDDIGETLGYAAWLAESPEETLATG